MVRVAVRCYKGIPRGCFEKSTDYKQNKNRGRGRALRETLEPRHADLVFRRAAGKVLGSALAEMSLLRRLKLQSTERTLSKPSLPCLGLGADHELDCITFGSTNPENQHAGDRLLRLQRLRAGRRAPFGVRSGPHDRADHGARPTLLPITLRCHTVRWKVPPQ